MISAATVSADPTNGLMNLSRTMPTVSRSENCGASAVAVMDFAGVKTLFFACSSAADREGGVEIVLAKIMPAECARPNSASGYGTQASQFVVKLPLIWSKLFETQWALDAVR